MNVILREYVDADFKACRSLWAELAQHHAEIYEDKTIAGDDPGRGMDDYLGRADRLATWVAESDGMVVGIAGLLSSKEMGEGGGEIEPVIVTEKWRSKGIGTKLVIHVVTESRKRGIRFLRVRPVARNIRAFQLYSRLGFDIMGNIEIFQDLGSGSNRTWKTGIRIHNQVLRY